MRNLTSSHRVDDVLKTFLKHKFLLVKLKDNFEWISRRKRNDKSMLLLFVNVSLEKSVKCKSTGNSLSAGCYTDSTKTNNNTRSRLSFLRCRLHYNSGFVSVNFCLLLTLFDGNSLLMLSRLPSAMEIASLMNRFSGLSLSLPYFHLSKRK